MAQESHYRKGDTGSGVSRSERLGLMSSTSNWETESSAVSMDRFRLTDPQVKSSAQDVRQSQLRRSSYDSLRYSSVIYSLMDWRGYPKARYITE